MRARTAAVAARAARDLAYLTIGLLTSVLALSVGIAGVTVSASLAPFVVGIPVAAITAGVFRALASLDRRSAALVLGHRLRGDYRDHRGTGVWSRAVGTLRDPQTWRDLAWLALHSGLGFGFGCAALTATAVVGGLLALPAWYWSIPAPGVDFGLWQVDTLGAAFATMPLAIPAAALLVALLRGMALCHARLAALLLGGRRPADPLRRGRALRAHGALALGVGCLCTLIWGVTSAGYFWPAWVWLGAAATLGMHVSLLRALAAGSDPQAVARANAERCAAIALLCVAIWALAGGGYFWPGWVMLGLAAGLGLRALLALRQRLPWVRERRLVERVDELTRTRRGALDAQAAELRRIERDLHDGAQARLVSLAMLIGRAEEQLEDKPETAALVRRAREEAGAAIAELRDLARGIAPPVLTDRGLAAAVSALASRAPMEVEVAASEARRPPPVVETAAYFVAAEGLTNAAKHGGGAPAQVAISRRGATLLVEVSDAGPGGADPSGSGLSGLRRRVEALDGRLRVESPAGGGTRITAELPCES